MLGQFGRRKFLFTGSAALGASIFLKACGTNKSDKSSGSGDSSPPASNGNTIKVGILHSLSGEMALSEITVVQAEKFAIKEINQAGGVLGKQIEVILEDGASDENIFKTKAEKLIDRDKVVTVFGCWTSGSRKAVLDVFESRNHMLWYPLQYEGQECSKNVYYTGAAPNQQIEPAVDWLLKNKGKEFFLVGSDNYLFTRTANAIVKKQLEARGALTVGEEYITQEDKELTPLFAKIKEELPDGGVIFNTINGDINVAFFQQMKRFGLGPDKYPVMSVSIAEEEVRQIGKEFLVGHYAAWNYFQTVETAANKKWVENFKAEYGVDQVTNDPMEAAYIMVYLWKQAVEKAGTADDLEKVRSAAIAQKFNAPEGEVIVQANHHISKTVRIGRVRNDGLFDIVWSTDKPVDPQPWNQFVSDTKGYACDWSDPSKGGKFKVEAKGGSESQT